jgi:uncharacterized protein YkwD
VKTFGRLPLALAVAAALLALLLPASAVAASPTVVNADSLEDPLVRKINRLRASKGLRKLRLNGDLTKGATKHARSMGTTGYFKHELYTPTRSTTWTPFGTWIRWYYGGYSWWTAGENLAWGSPSLTPRQTVRAWMRSDGHRANLLKRGWRHIGVAAVDVSVPSGYYGKYETVTIIAAEFGARG